MSEYLKPSEEETGTLTDLHSTEYDELFANAPWFKKYVDVSAREVTQTEEVVTILKDGHTETRNTANPGDFIITNPSGERYVLTPEKMSKRYAPIDRQPGRYKPVGDPVRAIVTPKDVSFTASWGEIKHMRAGDYLLDLNGERYGNGKNEFEETYAPL